MNSERIDLLERGDNFAPATASVHWLGSINVPANSEVTIPITVVSGIRGNVFEYVPSAQALRIKQAGVIGHWVNAVFNATGVAHINVLLRQASPFHDWSLAVQMYYLHPLFIFGVGGVSFVDVPGGGANYQIQIVNSGGSGSFTLSQITIRLAYLGRR